MKCQIELLHINTEKKLVIIVDHLSLLESVELARRCNARNVTTTRDQNGHVYFGNNSTENDTLVGDVNKSHSDRKAKL